MDIKKNKEPIKPGQRYFLEITADEEGNKYLFKMPPYGTYIKLLPSQVEQLYTTAAASINRCKDCKLAKPSENYARNIYCRHKHPGFSWDKMCKACEHFEPKEH